MILLPKILKHFNVFIDGLGYAGRVSDVVLPKLVLHTESYRLAGMDTPVQMDMGMEKLECELRFSEYDAEIIALFGMVDEVSHPIPVRGSFADFTIQNTPRTRVPLTLRGALQDDTNNRVIPVIIDMKGNMIELDTGHWRAGETATLKIRLALHFYKLCIDNKVLIEIDVDNRRRYINGKDQAKVNRFISDAN